MSGVTRFFSGPIYLLFLVNGGNVVNNFPFHDDLGLQNMGPGLSRPSWECLLPITAQLTQLTNKKKYSFTLF
jgi:hypothetical protein